MPSLSVVALVSGGKDSFFSMLHCLEHGHRIVALANLYPAPTDEEIDDLDSFMYQTIGHALIPLYEKALGIPLFRQAITGHAVSQTKTYVPAVGQTGAIEDETEALLPLLRRVMEAHPEVNAISTGAILSDYQRTRVESVALRLGLMPLSYLWQYPRIVPHSPTALLEDMAKVGQDARIIKVSSGGLDSSFLWENVADTRTIRRLLKASQLFSTVDDGAALGEGGEYETLTLSGPAPLWKGGIVVHDTDRSIMAGEAGSFSLRIASGLVEPLTSQAQVRVTRPALLEPYLSDICENLSKENWTDAEPLHCVEAPKIRSNGKLATCTIERLSDTTYFLAHWTAPGPSAQAQTEAIMQALEASLSSIGLESDDAAYASIVLRDMSLFPLINPIYGRFFKKPNPPARATIACAGVLEPGRLLSISITCVKTYPGYRQGLHVQSVSYWAPANIGPYSQAITVPDPNLGHKSGSTITYIAGQIPLIPSTMELDDVPGASYSQKFLHQAVLALQHLHRIAHATAVRCWKHAIAFIVAQDPFEKANRANIVRTLWLGAYRNIEDDEAREFIEDEDFDVWHMQQAARGVRHTSTPGETRFLLHSPLPQLTVIVADSLPRNSEVEWVAFGASGVDTIPEIRHWLHLLDLFSDQIV